MTKKIILDMINNDDELNLYQNVIKVIPLDKIERFELEIGEVNENEKDCSLTFYLLDGEEIFLKGESESVFKSVANQITDAILKNENIKIYLSGGTLEVVE